MQQWGKIGENRDSALFLKLRLDAFYFGDLIEVGIGADNMADIMIQHGCSMDGVSYRYRILVQKRHGLRNAFEGNRQDGISNIFQKFAGLMDDIFFIDRIVPVKYLLKYFRIRAYFNLCSAYLFKDLNTWDFEGMRGARVYMRINSVMSIMGMENKLLKQNGREIPRDRTYDEWIIALLLFIVCLIIFYPSFKFGFVSDDYNRITIHSLDHLLQSWKVVNFRRPLDELYYFVFYSLFGYNPLPYRLFLLVIYVFNSFLVYRLIRVLTRSQIIGVFTAILFVANTVQFRNIYWISCNLLLFATTFYLIAILLFLCYLENRKRNILWMSFAIVLGGVILTKEDPAAFPLIAVTLSAYITLLQKGTLERKDLWPVLNPTAVFWAVPFLFIAFRTLMSFIIGGQEECPYNLLDCLSPKAESPHRVSLVGTHILENLARQWFWNIGSFGVYWLEKPFNNAAGVLEWRDLGRMEYLIIFGSMAGLILLYWIFRKSTSWWYLFIGITWFMGGLSITTVLPEYVQNYFSAFSAIGLFLAIMTPFRSIMNSFDLRAVRIGMIGFAMLFLINSLYWMHANEKVNPITRSSFLLQQLEKDIKQKYPAFPDHTNLVFPSFGNWWLGYGIAPKVMYNNFTLNVFGGEDIVEKDGNIYSKKIELDRTKTHVFMKTKKGFHEVTPIFFKLYKGVIPAGNCAGILMSNGTNIKLAGLDYARGRGVPGFETGGYSDFNSSKPDMAFFSGPCQSP